MLNLLSRRYIADTTVTKCKKLYFSTPQIRTLITPKNQCEGVYQFADELISINYLFFKLNEINTPHVLAYLP